MRFVPPPATTNPRYTSKSCQHSGCEETTREGKPYCLHHVDKNPYARRLLDNLEQLEREHQRVRRRGPSAVDTKSDTSREILRELSIQRSCSVARLAQTLALPYPLTLSYVQALARRDLVVTSGFRRDRLQVSLSNPSLEQRCRGA